MAGAEFGGEKIELSELIFTLQTQVKEAAGGNLSRSEAMLVTQSQTPDLLFNQLTQRAVSNMKAEYLQATETYLKLAMRAQSQSSGRRDPARNETS